MSSINTTAHALTVRMVQTAESLPYERDKGSQASFSVQSSAANGSPAKVKSSGAQQQQIVPAQQPRTTDAATAIGMAVGHINSGNIDAALSLLDGAIASSPEPNMGALVARGTARALKRDLKGLSVEL